MQRNLLNTFFLIITLICTLQYAQATNQPSNCTGTITINGPTPYVTQQNINITVQSDNIPTLLTSYDINLYQNGTIIRSVYNVGFTILVTEPFTYTFTGIVLTAPVTEFYAVIYKNFLIYNPLVYVETNHVVVNALIETNLTLDQRNVASGLSGNIFIPILEFELVVTPLVPAGPTPLTSEVVYCTTYFNNNMSTAVNSDSGTLQRDENDLNFEGDCFLPSINGHTGDNVTVDLVYPGDTSYASSAMTVNFVVKSDYNYVAGDLVVTYPPQLNNRLLVFSSKNKSQKVKSKKKTTKNKKNDNRRRRRSVE